MTLIVLMAYFIEKRNGNMYWYFIKNKTTSVSSLMCFFKNQTSIVAFVPKIEKWFGSKKYMIQDMYSDYIFIKTCMNEKEFMKKYESFLKDIQGIAVLMKYGDSCLIDKNTQNIFDQLFDDEGVIVHSVGNIVNSQLIVDEGPLRGLEKYIFKIDRHRRVALLNLDTFQLKIPLEVISKS